MTVKQPIVIVAVVSAVVTVSLLAAYAYATPAFGMVGPAGGMMQGNWNSQGRGGMSMMSGMMGQGQSSGYNQGEMMGGMMGQGSHMGMGSNGAGCPYANGNQGNATTYVVGIVNYSFQPQTLRVPVGAKVTWINMDGVSHSVESGTHDAPTGIFESPLLSHMQSFSYTFTSPGTYVYHCDPHPNMTGTIIVE
ncbi:MAG: cupredoxin family copper-binding protein [Thaumarchaeota archaeon]|nr:cupredoxin family copper-binding protein [Nitrososphaerota archaeon]